MNKKLAQESITASQTNQTPFERFQSPFKEVLSVSPKDLPLLAKKSKKK